MEIIGHRGTAGTEFENTIKSIKEAIDIGVKYIEIDVRDTLDEKLIVFHDPYLDRLTSKKGMIQDMNYEEIKKIKLNNGNFIPTLTEIITIVKKSNVKLIVEAKTDKSILIALQLLEDKLSYSKFIIGSFFHENIKKIKDKNPHIQTAIMFEGIPVLFDEYLQTVNPDFIVTSIDTINDVLTETIKKQQRKLIFYTVNTEADMNVAIKMNPFGVITNYPNVFLKK